MTSIRERRNAFIGRDADVRAVLGLLESRRLVTVTGVGGVGKTRLAMHVANVFAHARSRKAWAVSLAEVREPEQVALALMRTLGLADRPDASPRDIVVTALAQQESLVLLDNCEHLLDTVCDLVDDLLDSLPNVSILTTSRRALSLDGEGVYPLAPLGTMTADGGVSDAVTLLIERAKDSDARFDAQRQDLSAALALCRTLDGLPLAIELAAARLRSLSIAELADRIESRFTLPPGDRRVDLRQRTLRAVVDWSYDLCTPDERRVWAALSVFSGTFSTAAAIAVSVDADLDEVAAWSAFEGLVAQSLVEQREPGRHRLLETIREYGRDRARESGTWDDTRRRHLAHFCELVRTHRTTFHGPGQAAALARLRQEWGELQAGLTFAVADDSAVEEGARLVSDLRYHWAVGGFLREGRKWVGSALARGPSPLLRAELHTLGGWLALVQGDLDTAAAHLDAAQSLLAGSADREAAVVAMEVSRWLGSHALFRGDLDQARELFTRSIGDARALGDEAATLMSAFQLTVAEAHAHARDAALPADEARRLAEALDESWMRSHALWSLSVAALSSERPDDAAALVREALAIERSFHDDLGTCLMLETWAAIACRQAHHESAAVVWAALADGWRRVGSDIAAFGPHLAAQHDAAIDRTRTALDRTRFAAAWERGRRLDLVEAVVFALDTADAASPLSIREREVADGIHRGLSNREIAAELVISVRTVETHVQHIFTKLSVSSRTRIAAWVERGSAGRNP
ncbi:helix-turn-helix transcriptional regulator [Microbacterium sp. Clip185]|uniref:helix-turn-helix transcriptional regulator n=1 Tax=Microbacterium sp. Clip185 TaxID=3025663 RepID=UPI002365C6CE|nr:LuxR C-terminal-related transcriptional regulator [Microbacterium sp. Clip185]WDG18399.1 LuxR C-terminal-related transcriptional regulator [Microbacterium sp. Clip185]